MLKLSKAEDLIKLFKNESYVEYTARFAHDDQLNINRLAEFNRQRKNIRNDAVQKYYFETIWTIPSGDMVSYYVRINNNEVFRRFVPSFIENRKEMKKKLLPGKEMFMTGRNKFKVIDWWSLLIHYYHITKGKVFFDRTEFFPYDDGYRFTEVDNYSSDCIKWVPGKPFYENNPEGRIVPSICGSLSRIDINSKTVNLIDFSMTE